MTAKPRSWVRPIALALGALLLSACGFHLAGNRPLPERLKNVRIDVVEHYRAAEPPVEVALRTHLQLRGAEISEKKNKEGVTVIRLIELRETRQTLSVGSDGKAQEYQLITRVTFDARTGDDLWSPPQQLEARQDYSFNAQQVLAKEQEADRLREYLQNQLAELILLRLEADAARPSPPKEAPQKASSSNDPAAALPPAAAQPGAGATDPTAEPPPTTGSTSGAAFPVPMPSVASPSTNPSPPHPVSTPSGP